MSLSYVNLTLDALYDGAGTPLIQGAIALTPTAQVTDAHSNILIPQAPSWLKLQPSPPSTVELLATDNAHLAPAAWAWTISFSSAAGNPVGWTFYLAAAGGASQNLSGLPVISNVPGAGAFLPLRYLPGASAGYVWTVSDSGNGSWQPATGGGGAITSVNTQTGVVVLTAAEVGALAAAGGTMTGYLAPAVVPLTYGPTITVNAQLGNVFTLTLTGATAAIANPTNPVNGQVIRIRLTQDGTGSRAVTWGSAYDWGGGNSAPTLTTTAGKTDVLAFEYNSASSTWMYLGAPVPQGF